MCVLRGDRAKVFFWLCTILNFIVKTQTPSLWNVGRWQKHGCGIQWKDVTSLRTCPWIHQHSKPFLFLCFLVAMYLIAVFYCLFLAVTDCMTIDLKSVNEAGYGLKSPKPLVKINLSPILILSCLSLLFCQNNEKSTYAEVQGVRCILGSSGWSYSVKSGYYQMALSRETK